MLRPAVRLRRACSAGPCCCCCCRRFLRRTPPHPYARARDASCGVYRAGSGAGARPPARLRPSRTRLMTTRRRAGACGRCSRLPMVEEASWLVRASRSGLNRSRSRSGPGRTLARLAAEKLIVDRPFDPGHAVRLGLAFTLGLAILRLALALAGRRRPDDAIDDLVPASQAERPSRRQVVERRRRRGRGGRGCGGRAAEGSGRARAGARPRVC